MNDYRWADDDGVLRCDDCHTNVATAWGGGLHDVQNTA